MNRTSDLALPLGNIESYIYWTHQLPLLTADEERALAVRLREEGDLDAARRMVLSHLRFVVRIARGYLGYGLPHADLIQEGNIGLMKAVKRFDPSMGVRLVSFAVHWIKAEIHEFILRNWRIVKVATTKAQRKLFFNLRKATKRLGWFSEAEICEVARDLRVSTDEVRRMEMRLNAGDVAFDASAPEDGDDTAGGKAAPAYYLEDQRTDPARQLEAEDWSETRETRLRSAMETLDTRSQDILRRRWLADEKATLHELAAEHHVSAERIRQLEAGAMARLKRALG